MSRVKHAWLWFAVVALLCVALTQPTKQVEHDAANYVFVLDITQSMNTEDYYVQGKPVSRLAFAKGALRETLLGLACGSKVGLAVFTEYRTFLLLAPVEVCDNFADLASALGHIDGRMAWAGGSEVAKGLNWGLKAMLSLSPSPNLVFLTDGQEAPPINPKLPPRIDIGPGKVHGLIVGVGGDELSPIPKFDPQGNRLGYWKAQDVLQVDIYTLARTGSEGKSEVARRPSGTEHLSSLKEIYLRHLAADTGLAYHRLAGAAALSEAFRALPKAQRVKSRVDLAWVPAAASLFLLVALYATALLRGSKRPRALA